MSCIIFHQYNTAGQPDYLHNLIAVQSTCRTRSSSSSPVTLARPSVSSSLQNTNHLPLFHICIITSPVESAPFFILSTSFSSLSWFTSSIHTSPQHDHVQWVSEWVSIVLRPLQHSIGYTGDGFYNHLPILMENTDSSPQGLYARPVRPAFRCNVTWQNNYRDKITTVTVVILSRDGITTVVVLSRDKITIPVTE